ncbi:MAG: aminotransferase class I/II-fold pyridoxal phosphate-dependent enzyme [Actinomycetota bacterium]|nr:aminotransferase class I/II-fold pyridoxal phosphate-dependent enzyme [Actinomycetota bacterium]
MIGGSTAGEIAASVEAAIRDGQLAPGARLPPIRTLANECSVSPMTVASAYRELGRRGLLVTGGRRGTRVAERPPLPVRTRIYVPPGARDLASGNPDPELLPPLAAALERLDPGPRLYLEEGKLPALVELAMEQFGADGIAVPALAVVGGALDGIERVLQAHLRPGDSVAVEDPGFVRAYDLLRPLGLYLEPVAVDDFGPHPDALERALARGARALILTPRAQNPTGAALDEQRADELRTLLDRRADVLVIEDDHAAGVAGFRAFSVCAGERPNWATVRSVSKSLGPDLRVALLVGDPTTIARVEGRQLLGTGWVSRILQQIVVAFWSDPVMRERLGRAEEIYTARRLFLLDALAARGIAAHGRSGFNVLVPVTEEAAAVTALLQRGWAVTAMERWRLEGPPAVRITTATLARDEAEQLAADVAAALGSQSAVYSA